MGSWVSAQQLVEPQNLPPTPGLGAATLRQVVQLSLGSGKIRVVFSNAFGNGPVTLASANVALAGEQGAIQEASLRPLKFQGRSEVTIQAGAAVVSDPLEFDAPALTRLAVTTQFTQVPSNLTGHPGSRTTSFILAGAEPPKRLEHWYFLSGIDILAPKSAAAVVTLGDSITDGRGSITDQNTRWPNLFFKRLQARPEAKVRPVAVLNQGVGGNRVLQEGLGPSALARLDRDVLAHPGVRWLVLFEGINDLGAKATAEEIIAAYAQMILRAHDHQILVYGVTLPPCGGSQYFNSELEAARQAINAWIRGAGHFDGVIDFDTITRDPEHPSWLSPKVDGGDHLHPSAAGYQIMADAIDLKLFDK
jgi:lysophospholipase L1-like esterase